MSRRHAAMALLLLLTGCERAVHDMYVQPRYAPGSPSGLFADGYSGRTPPAGTVPWSESQPITEAPSVTMAVLQRGRQRFNIYCAPCHGESGDGGGMVVRRGFPAPPSYHTDALRSASDAHLYDVISNGYGVMYPYGDRIDPEDRWSIVAYIRALQLSQNAACNRLGEEDLRHLGGCNKQ
jgi:mono/diheme cytochrome c family protein